MNLNNVFINTKSNIFINVQGNQRTSYSNKEMTKIKAVAQKYASSYNITYYYSPGKVSTRIQANYSKNIPTKILRTVYYTNGKVANSFEVQSANLKRKKEITRSAVSGKQKITLQDFYNNANNRLTQKFKYFYGKNANYVSDRRTYNYNANGKRTSYTRDVYNNKGKRINSYYETIDVRTNKLNGVTRTWFNAINGKVVKKEITIKNIKYFSQRDRRWASSRCYKAPYNVDINNMGCMLSSFAMINSKYNTALNPAQIKAKGLDCFFDYNKAAQIFGYNVQNTWSTQGYTRNINTNFANSKRLVPNGKSTFTIKDALEKHMPVQLWMAHNKGREHLGHSVVAYKYVYQNGKGDFKFYDPYTPNTPTRSLKDLSSRWWLTKAEIWVKK